MTLGELFPGNVGRVVLTRVAVRLRMPALLKTPPTAVLDEELAAIVVAAAEAVKRG
jgi:hypothetical protein